MTLGGRFTRFGNLGLESGPCFHLTSYCIWGFAILSSPTLRDALEIGLRFVDLTFAFSLIQARQVANETQLVLETPESRWR
ncbi:AraC family transcriptional regulator ligand-binding domain-containing protein [Nocardia sp. CA-107356]|uniref:AraC family transcriptional regulator ligand-binding domain-containing protein n=1 Tax=Nocardia sp. CA-107356 TaxID=3239972 RepID=UPI003D8C1574